ncbi:hypothetical protein DPMN_081200 [Dreissena polymorpha]|uniref:Uncharacterized protein n=1 Tax=Dreissena polymorpha TaxID=45954 RepID=A0A9D4BFQ2_DREPO|nr:hypothetical protein DPMN_081200 [Dreissena polymorpha]
MKRRAEEELKNRVKLLEEHELLLSKTRNENEKLERDMLSKQIEKKKFNKQ